MTQSKKDDSFTINVSNLKLDDILDTTGDIIINLNDTYGTTTTYWSNDSISDIAISGANDGTFTIDTNSVDWLYMIPVLIQMKLNVCVKSILH
jgi:hypothetical protein